MEGDMIHILIADQQTLMRSGIRRLLSDESDISVVAEAERIEQALATIRLSRVDVLLMDINLPGTDSVEATRRLLRLNQDLKIVVLGAHASGPYPVHLFKAGIAGYLTKSSSGEEMLACIRKVSRGQRHVSADVAQTLLLDQVHNGNAPLACLTQRELSVLVLLSQGHHRSEISTKLCVSPKTISTYRTRLLRKLGARSDVELTHLSLRHGLITPMESCPA
jgi:two-component system invasion response regulator UvrY